MNGFNDKGLQKIWDGLGLPANIRMQEDFERLACEWKEADIIRCRDCVKSERYTNRKNVVKYLCHEFEDLGGNAAPVDADGFCAWGVKQSR